LYSLVTNPLLYPLFFVFSKEPFLLLMSLIGLGMAAGPIQPINAELSCDITYPGDETAVESVQQIGGNMISALLVPVAEFASRRDYLLLPNNPLLESDIRGDCLLLLTVAALTMAYFSTFDAPLARTRADRRSESDPSTSLDVSDAPLSSKV
jgi:FLVCR family feline leukemia virus subgroup C receptor-related protein